MLVLMFIRRESCLLQMKLYELGEIRKTTVQQELNKKKIIDFLKVTKQQTCRLHLLINDFQFQKNADYQLKESITDKIAGCSLTGSSIHGKFIETYSTVKKEEELVLLVWSQQYCIISF